ncbi:Protein of unknown function [Cotesia congregata]|uniref:Uncharacterized protein n=1 Tax=Cotesia congregata TaxID=51543 RepID=A0A8J2HSA2_COTCN|nr:Protein of unknown function [Cotesia congregata]
MFEPWILRKRITDSLEGDEFSVIASFESLIQRDVRVMLSLPKSNKTKGGRTSISKEPFYLVFRSMLKIYYFYPLKGVLWSDALIFEHFFGIFL